MNFEDFKISLNKPNPPESWSPGLKAMWFDFNDNWEEAHNISQDINSSITNRIHGYLHWKEGDLWNARYWYRQAGMNFPGGSMDEEAKAIVINILDKNDA